MDRIVNLITDLNERKIVMINDVRFQSRRAVDWQKVEKSLKKYIGKYFEIAETSEKILIFAFGNQRVFLPFYPPFSILQLLFLVSL